MRSRLENLGMDKEDENFPPPFNPYTYLCWCGLDISFRTG